MCHFIVLIVLLLHILSLSFADLTKEDLRQISLLINGAIEPLAANITILSSKMTTLETKVTDLESSVKFMRSEMVEGFTSQYHFSREKVSVLEKVSSNFTKKGCDGILTKHAFVFDGEGWGTDISTSSMRKFNCNRRHISQIL